MIDGLVIQKIRVAIDEKLVEILGKKKDEDEIPLVRVEEMTGTSVVGVKTFTDIKIVAKALGKPILRLPRVGDTQKFIVLDSGIKYSVEVKIAPQ